MSAPSGRCLIIASWNGLRRHETPDNEDLLAEHHRRLSTLRHSLDRILVVQNRSPRRKEIPDNLALFDRPLVRDNINGSYGAWIDGFRAEPNYEWYFLIEDDYFFDIDDFDQRMIDLWTPKTTYLAAMIQDTMKYPLHAAISNGLTRGDVLAKLDFNFPTIHIYNDFLQIGWSSQFVRLGMDLGYPGGGLRDVLSDYSCPYWNGALSRVEYATEKPILMRPAQMPTNSVVKDGLQV